MHAFFVYNLELYTFFASQMFETPVLGAENYKISLKLVLLVSCSARVRLPARNDLVNKVEFLGLITQNG